MGKETHYIFNLKEAWFIVVQIIPSRLQQKMSVLNGLWNSGLHQYSYRILWMLQTEISIGNAIVDREVQLTVQVNGLSTFHITTTDQCLCFSWELAQTFLSIHSLKVGIIGSAGIYCRVSQDWHAPHWG